MTTYLSKVQISTVFYSCTVHYVYMYCTVSSKIDTKVFSTVRVHCTRTSTRTCTVQLVTRRATVRVRVQYT